MSRTPAPTLEFNDLGLSGEAKALEKPGDKVCLGNIYGLAERIDTKKYDSKGQVSSVVFRGNFRADTDKGTLTGVKLMVTPFYAAMLEANLPCLFAWRLHAVKTEEGQSRTGGVHMIEPVMEPSKAAADPLAPCVAAIEAFNGAPSGTAPDNDSDYGEVDPPPTGAGKRRK